MKDLLTEILVQATGKTREDITRDHRPRFLPVGTQAKEYASSTRSSPGLGAALRRAELVSWVRGAVPPAPTVICPPCR